MASSCTRGGLDRIGGKNLSMKGQSGIGSGCPESGGITTPGMFQKHLYEAYGDMVKGRTQPG